MKLKSILLATMLAGSLNAAYAGTIDGLPTPDILLQQNTANPFKYSGNFGNDQTGVFTDIFTFLPAATAGTKVNSSFISFDLDGFGLIAFTGATLNGVAFTQTGVDRWSLAGTILPAAGPLVLTVMGNAGSGGSYAGVLNVTLAPVPEPETYAMLLGGLGLLGVMARRRKQS